MTVNTNINAFAIKTATKITQKVEAKAAQTQETAPTKGDGVDLGKGGYKSDTIPSDDDGPGAGGGYTPSQDPAESDGPGAGGGYNSREIPSDDDGPGAGGGYTPSQDPTESDGPGAGGGYFQISNFSDPLAVFTTSSSQFSWSSILPEYPISWSGTTLYAEAQAPKTPEEKKAEEKKSK